MDRLVLFVMISGMTTMQKLFAGCWDTNCLHAPWKSHDCGVVEIAGVRCLVSDDCSNTQFQCSSGSCIDASSLCDLSDDCDDGSDEADCKGTKVRLANGSHPWEGRVELIRNGMAGTICDDHWDDKDADVICRMLGYRYGGIAIVGVKFGLGTGVIWLDEVECQGNEDSIDSCKHFGWTHHDCAHAEDAAVFCHQSPSPTTTIKTTTTTTIATTSTELVCSQTEFRCSRTLCIGADKLCDLNEDCPDGSDEKDCDDIKVRLINGTDAWEGRVELIRNGVAGTICDDQWDDRDADVICRMLGYRYGGMAVTGRKFGAGSGLIWLEEVECVGNEKSINFCEHYGWTQHDCSHDEDAGVHCFKSSPITQTTPTITTSTTTIKTSTEAESTIKVSLVRGETKNEGNVVLTFRGNNYRICDDSWDDRDATVVCRMLGYYGGGKATTKSYFGRDNNEIFLDEVLCSGNEETLLDCRANVGTNAHDCGINEQAGVICRLGEFTSTTSGAGIIRKKEAVCGLRPYDSKDLNTWMGHRKRRSLTESEKPNFPPHIIGSLAQDKILGGQFADHGAYPWQVRVVRLFNFRMGGTVYSTHSCGAVIIGEYWILSAAHCFWGKRTSKFRFIVGDHHKKKRDRGEQIFRVENIYVHPNYRGPRKDYDISLIKIQPVQGRGIQFNDYVQPACLPTEQTPYIEGTKCLVSGWGSTRQGYPNTLKSVDLPLISWDKCRYLYDYRKTGFFTRRMFCAGFLEGGHDTCDGDSGGPLVCNVDGAYTLFGITTFGWGCAKPNAPGVYSRVSEFLPWINEVIRLNGRGTAEKALPKRP